MVWILSTTECLGHTIICNCHSSDCIQRQSDIKWDLISNQCSACTAFEIGFFRANTQNPKKYHAKQIHMQSISGFPPKIPQADLKNVSLDLFIEEVGFEEGFFPSFLDFQPLQKSFRTMRARAYKVGSSSFIKHWRTPV